MRELVVMLGVVAGCGASAEHFDDAGTGVSYALADEHVAVAERRRDHLRHDLASVMRCRMLGGVYLVLVGVAPHDAVALLDMAAVERELAKSRAVLEAPEPALVGQDRTTSSGLVTST